MTRGRLAAIVLAFLVTRLVVTAVHDPEIHTGDQFEYVRVAQSIVAHGATGYFAPGFVIEKGRYYPWYRGMARWPDGRYNPIFWDPLYPLFVASVFAVAGESLDAVRYVQIAVSLATLLLGMAVVRRLLPEQPRAPEFFGWLAVAYLPFAGYTTKIMPETLDGLLLVGLVWLITRLPGQRLLDHLLFGLAFGVYVQIRSYFMEFLPIVMLLLAWLWWGELRRAGQSLDRGLLSRQFLALALVVVGFVAALAPTYVRNHHISGGHLVLSTKGNWNVWMDNNGFQLRGHDWRQSNGHVHKWTKAYYRRGDVDRVSKKLKHVYWDESNPAVRPPCDVAFEAMSGCERRNAIAWALEDLPRWVWRAALKNAATWSPNNYIFNRGPPGDFAWHQNYRVELSTFVRYVLQIYVMGLYVLVMVAGLWGLTAHASNEAQRYAAPFVLASILFLVFIVMPMGHGVSRFRLPFMWPISMFAVLGLMNRSELLRALEFESVAGRVRGGILVTLLTGFLIVVAVQVPRLLAAGAG